MQTSIHNRRTFLKSAAALAALQTYPLVALSESSTPLHLPVSFQPAHHKATVPQNFLGLSYEASQLSAPDFFSPENEQLVALFRSLSPNGVLRLGGNLSEYTVWTGSGPVAKPTIPFRAVGADPNAKKTITPASISEDSVRQLRLFLDATGWRVLYGLNLAHANSDRTAAEAHFAARTLGDKLIAFQIGNEPDHYVLNGLRPAGYNFDQYLHEWTEVHTAVTSAVPHAVFAGPDIAERVDWVEEFAQRAPSSVVLLTGHHYAEGPPSDPSMTLTRLLTNDGGLKERLDRTRAIASDSGRPYCMAETNSCYSAGKQGVSDVFGAALWALDYAMTLAQSSERGVYFHGGASGWYTPIAGGSGHPFSPRPVYAGLLLARELLGADMVPSTIPVQADVSLYAFRAPSRVLAINKGPRNITLELPQKIQANAALYMTAPSPTSRNGILVGGVALEDITQRRPQFTRMEPTGKLNVAPYSAALFALSPSTTESETL